MADEKQDKSTKEKKVKKKKEKKEESESESAAPAPAAASGEGGEEKKDAKQAKRGTSNVFALFNQSQIQEFKEAFTMMDQNRDGIIDLDDLLSIHQQLGRDPDQKSLNAMLEESPGQLNFTHFLTLFGEKLHGTDPESTLRDAFVMFDEDHTGKLSEEYFKDLLMNTGDLYSKDEIKQTWKEAPIESGQLDYLKFVRLIKRGDEVEA